MLDDVGTFKRVPLSTTEAAEGPKIRGVTNNRLSVSTSVLFSIIANYGEGHDPPAPPPIFSGTPAPPSTTTISCTELIWVAVHRVSSVPGKYMEGLFFFTIFTAAPWLWLLALFFVVGCPGEDTGYIFHLFFIGLKPAKLLQIQYGWKYKTLSNEFFFSSNHTADPPITKRMKNDWVQILMLDIPVCNNSELSLGFQIWGVLIVMDSPFLFLSSFLKPQIQGVHPLHPL